MDFAVPGDHRIKLKESEKNKYHEVATELKKTIEQEGDNYTKCYWCIIQATALLRTARILRGVLET